MTKPNKTKSKTAPRNAAPVAKPQSEAARVAAVLRASVDYQAPKGGVPHQDRDVVRASLIRRMNTLLRFPARCGDALCRRTRRCVGLTMRCDRDFPALPLTPEQHAEAAASMRAALRRRLVELGRETDRR